MIFRAIFSRASGSRPANCQATAAAEDTSITESRPNPISAVEDAFAPAVSATTASITFADVAFRRRGGFGESGRRGRSDLGAASVEPESFPDHHP